LEKRGDGVLEEDESGMTKGRLTRGGWISIANGLFTVPAVGMSFYLGSDEGIGTAMAQALLTLVSLGLFLYILSTLRLLLNVRFRFHEVDVFISYLMWGNLSLSLFHLLTLITREFEWAVGVLSVIAYIFFGILSILFATRLLKLPGGLYGLLKPFSYLSLLSGICFVSVMLLPVGILVGAASDVVLGVIFFRAAEEPLSPDEIFSRPIG
jgi:hypothetical protein